MKIILAAVGYAVLFGLIELVSRRTSLGKELSRKIAHIAAGTSAAFLPFVMSFQEVMILSLIFVPVMAVSKKRNIFRSIHQVNRMTFGEIYFPIAIFLTALLFPDRRLFMYGVLVMGISDGLASVVGQAVGGRTYRIWRARKSYAGSLAFFITTVMLALLVQPAVGPIWAVAVALLLTLVEAALPDGSDNLVLPVAASGLLLLVGR